MSGKYQLEGQRFGRLKVIRENGRGRSGGVAWLCLCDCGNYVTVEGYELVRGNNKSCGCSHGERHGHSDDRLYSVWQTMKRRCDLRTSPRYSAYGGRGIKVCEEWASSFTAFRTWALENGYDYNAPYGECTIDRIDVNGDYCPENCRWVDIATQSKNRRPAPKHSKGIEVTYKGVSYKSVSELAEEYGIHPMRLFRRIHRMSIDDAMEQALAANPKLGGHNYVSTGA